MNIFDNISKNVFDTMRPTFGYSATWTPSGGGSAVTKTVLYKQPTETEGLGGADFAQDAHTIEFYETDFPGLVDSVEERNNERISLQDSGGNPQTFLVQSCKRIFDGKTITAQLKQL